MNLNRIINTLLVFLFILITVEVTLIIANYCLLPTHTIKEQPEETLHSVIDLFEIVNIKPTDKGITLTLLRSKMLGPAPLPKNLRYTVNIYPSNTHYEIGQIVEAIVTLYRTGDRIYSVKIIN